MKYVLASLVVVTFMLATTSEMRSQDIQKFDFLEIIVIQKANNKEKIKRIKVEEQESLEGKIITIKALEKLEGTSDLLNYMNAFNWEFVDRQSIVSEENDPVWMSYIFRKAK